MSSKDAHNPIETTFHVPQLDNADKLDGLHLVVMGPSTFSVHRLTEGRRVMVGRDDNVDIRLSDPLASRQHACLSIESDQILVEDPGSANGTRVRDNLIPKSTQVVVALGESITIGSTVLVLRRSRPAEVPFRVVEHEYFEERLRQECDRAHRFGGFLAVVRLRITGVEDPAVVANRVAESARESLSQTDLLAIYADDDFELLLIGAPPEKAQEIVSELSLVLNQRGLAMQIATAYFPYHGLTADALIAKTRTLILDEPESATGDVVVANEAMQRVHDLVERAAHSDANVLILGETGVGKNVLAEKIHRLSGRRRGPLMTLNCASLPDSLVETELFGHEKGAFTGAVSARPGLLESAAGGSFFLDEIGDLPLNIQAKLLDALQSRQVRRVGGRHAIGIDVRFIAATHRDLEAEAERGSFRADLYYRINVVSLCVPPLRERIDEIPALARAFVSQVCQREKRAYLPRIQKEAMRLLEGYAWPGNVRQLQNVVERAVILSNGEEITPDDLPETIFRPTIPAPDPGGESRPRDPLHAQILEALIASNGNQSRAAKLLKIHRLKLNRLMVKYGIPRLQDG